MADLGFGFQEKTGAKNQWATSEHINLFTGDVSAVRVFEGPWADRMKFVVDKLSPLLEIDGAEIFRLPDEYPFFRTAFATTIDIVGRGISTQDDDLFPVWTRAEITVKYEAKPYNAGFPGGTFDPEAYVNRVFIEESCDSSYEQVQVHAKESFEPARTSPTGSIIPKRRLAKEGFWSFILNLNIINLKLVNILRPNWWAIDALIGTINNIPFITPAGRAFPKGTVRYEGPSGFTKVNIFTGGGEPVEIEGLEEFPLPLWEMNHTFLHNRFGWNKRFVRGIFKDIEKEDGKPFFHEFSNLFDLFFAPGVAGFDNAILQLIDTLLAELQILLNANSNNFSDPAVIAKQNEILVQQRLLGFRV